MNTATLNKEGGQGKKSFGECACCSGNHLLQALLEQKEQQDVGIQPEKLKPADWSKQSMAGMVRQLMFGYHLFLRAELPLLHELTTLITSVHGSQHRQLIELQQRFHALKVLLEQHLIDEEECFFPLILKYERQHSATAFRQAKQMVEKLEGDHRRIGNMLLHLRLASAHYVLPDDACEAFAYTYTRLKQLEAKLLEHIRLENHYLFYRL
ncbi:hemerythrin domain-containing protein [Paenibacillus algorifonticola]|uniref:hemerythrin domain-containing protein n=1 Tax=Paenibacillus algorifonticola TaxID=684063 RepID=UPI003D29F5A8